MKTATSVFAISAVASATNTEFIGGLGGLGGGGLGGLGGNGGLGGGLGGLGGSSLLQGGGLQSKFQTGQQPQQQVQYVAYQPQVVYAQPTYQQPVYQQQVYQQPVYQQPIYQQPTQQPQQPQQPQKPQVPTYDISGTHGKPVAAPEAPQKPKKPVYGSGYLPSDQVRDVTFGTCELKNDDDKPRGVINFFQAPGWAMKVKGELEGLTIDTDYVLRITDYGDISGGMCQEMGEEFNPLAPEPKITWRQDHWGGWIEQKTPQTNEDGRIDTVTADAGGKVSFRQEDFLQNLAGKYSLFGRGMQLYEKDSDVVLACCVIGRDTYREPAAEM